MKRFLVVTSIILCVLFLLRQAKAQGTQTVVNGSQTTPITFPSGGCSYNWVNNTPAIGLAASGTGDIAAFTAVNTGKTPISATITATPISTVFAYIANQFSNNVSVVNTTTNMVIATIPVGDHPTGVSVSADGNKVYVTNYNDNTVSVINTATNTVSFTIAVGSNPYGICVSPDGSRVYVANYHSNSVSVISTASNTVQATVPVGSYPYGIAISPDGTRVYCASSNDNTMSVINTATNTVIATVAVGPHPYGVIVGADGMRVYVSSAYSNTITVVNTTNNTIVTTIKANYVSDTPAMSLSPDGSRLYLVDTYIAVINTATNAIINYIPANTPYSISISPDGNFLYGTDENTSSLWTYNLTKNMGVGSTKVGLNPISFGNFVKGPNCQPIEFTITVNPTSITPAITVSSATGTISACQGSPSASPDIQQFTVSGSSLTNNITATAPAGFEVSLSAGNGYGNMVTVPQSGATANNTIVYVRSAASATGNISGNVTLTSQGANTQNVAVSGKVNPLPNINAVSNQTFVTGNSTTAINFTGTANTFSWTNSNPAIGLSASGTGDIPVFAAVNNSTMPITATFTITPINTTTGCSGAPITFTIEVDPILPAVITATGTLPPLSTIYGTASPSTSFSVSGTNMTAGILVTPPAGFEVSTDNTNFSPTVTVGTSGTINMTTVYVRLTSKTPVGSYSANIVLSSSGATSSTVPIPFSVVNPAILTITANNVQKVYGQTLISGTVSTGFTSKGLQNNETIGNVFIAYNSGASPSDKAGTYTGSVVPADASGGSFNPKNYTITYQSGDIIVIEGLPNQAISIPNAFTPNGDGINDVWNIKSLIDYPSCLVSIFTRYGSMIYQSRGYAKPWDGVYNGNPLPTGTYYYIINLQNGQPAFSGWVALIR